MSVIRMLSFCHDRTVSNLSKPCPNLDLNANTASETPSRLSRTPSWIQAHMLVPVQPIERSHLLVRELEIEDVSVGDDSPFGIRFGKRDESTAGQKIPMSMAFARTQIENPLTLSASSIESIPEPSSSPVLRYLYQRRVRGLCPLDEGRVRFKRDVVGLAIGDDRRLLAVITRLRVIERMKDRQTWHQGCSYRIERRDQQWV